MGDKSKETPSFRNAKALFEGNVIHLMWYGERSRALMGLGSDTITCSLISRDKEETRSLFAHFKSGNISGISFQSRDEFDPNRGEHVELQTLSGKFLGARYINTGQRPDVDLDLKQEDIERLMSQGKMRVTKEKAVSYDLLVEGSAITLKRFVGIDLEDNITIPVKIDPEEIKRKFVKPVPEDSPENHPELDENWRSVNLEEITGIEWEQH